MRYVTDFACQRLCLLRCPVIESVGIVVSMRRPAFSFSAADGRVSFTVPKLFECSICLRGAEKDAGWFFVSVEFLFTVGGDPTGMQGS
jgi:hypothetical protein